MTTVKQARVHGSRFLVFLFWGGTRKASTLMASRTAMALWLGLLTGWGRPDLAGGSTTRFVMVEDSESSDQTSLRRLSGVQNYCCGVRLDLAVSG